MKMEDKTREKCCFHLIENGRVFLFNNEAYIKTDSSHGVLLTNNLKNRNIGETFGFEGLEVEIVNAKIVIEAFED